MALIKNLAATLVGARVAGASRRYGVLGVAAGALAARAVLRWPLGMAIVGGIYVVRALTLKKRLRETNPPMKVITDQRVAPVDNADRDNTRL